MPPTIIGRTESDAWTEAQRRFEHARQTGDVKAWVAEQQTRGMVFGSAEQAAERFRTYVEAGCSRFYMQVVPSASGPSNGVGIPSEQAEVRARAATMTASTWARAGKRLDMRNPHHCPVGRLDWHGTRGAR